MANHSYIDMPKNMGAKKAMRIALDEARACVDPALECRMLEGERPRDGRRLVKAVFFLPGTDDVTYHTSAGPPDPIEPIGFEVWWVELFFGQNNLGRLYEFRHPLNRWAWWAQGALRERLAARFSGFTRGDGWDARPARTDWPKTYLEFVGHEEREMKWAPPSHRTERK